MNFTLPQSTEKYNVEYTTVSGMIKHITVDEAGKTAIMEHVRPAFGGGKPAARLKLVTTSNEIVILFFKNIADIKIVNEKDLL